MMGSVVGEPKLDRFRKDRENTKASFYIYWTDSVEGSKELSTRTNDYKAALKVFDSWRLTSIGKPVSRPIQEVLVQEILDYYRTVQISRNKSVERLDYSLKRLEPFWGHRPASVVGPILLKEYEQHRFDLHDELFPHGETISINTIRRELVDLRSAMSRAEKDQLVDQRIFVELPSEIKKGVEYFSCDEALGLIRAATKVRRSNVHLPLFMKIGFLTGRRKASILGLKWDDIDFETGIIGWQLKGQAETKKRRPNGKLPPRLKKILLRHRAEHPDDEYVISYQSQRIKDIKKSFSQAVKIYRENRASELGVAPSSILPSAYPHMMRHSNATWQMQKGTDKRELCGFLGMTEETLERRYWHQHPDFQRGAANAF